MKAIKLSVFFALLLTGCSSYNNDFDCPIGSGLKCASLSEVNERIDDGTWPQEAGSKASCPGCQKVHWASDLQGEYNLAPRTLR